MFADIIIPHYSGEEIDWIKLTPEKRFRETTKLWDFYLAMGGSLDIQPDPQSPFYFPETQGKSASHRRAGKHNLRRG